jgi:DNA (cytosine-5)-methyltransferase 1
VCRLQGLPPDFDLPPFLAAEKKKAVGNGVPLVMGRVLAQAVIDAFSQPASHGKLCKCGCGRPVKQARALYAANEQGDTSACRKRAQRNRERDRDRPGNPVGHR